MSVTGPRVPKPFVPCGYAHEVMTKAGAFCIGGPERITRPAWYAANLDNYTAGPMEPGAAFRKVHGCASQRWPLSRGHLVDCEAVSEIQAPAVLPDK